VANLELFDTTLRDGTQGEGVSLSAEDKLKVVKRLDQLGINIIEGGNPGSNPKDIEFFNRVKSLELIQAQIAAFGSTRRANIKVEDDVNLRNIVNTKVKIATIFGKAWTFHVTDALRTTLDENLNMIEESVQYLVSHGIRVIFDAEHFFDGYFADPSYAVMTLKAAVKGGADTVVLCDTNGGRLPKEIYEVTQSVIDELNKVRVGIHAHNDSGVAVANSLMAVEAGATHIQGTINGFGERCGNADLIQIIANLQLKMGYNLISGEQIRGLTEASRYINEIANIRPDDRQPFVGRSVFAHKGGMHVSALIKQSQTYEHIDPESVGNKRRVLVSELSGASTIMFKAKEYNLDLQKDSPALKQVVDKLKELEFQGYHFEGAEASFELLVKKELGLYQPYFHLIGFRMISDKFNNDGALAEATLKIEVGQQVFHTAGEGNGPVNALDKALRKALEQVYPQLKEIRLTDYKVRVLNERGGTASKVRVLIESALDGRSWSTVGVSANIIEASWQALVDSVEYGLMISGVTPLAE
jgi:2-isopropylmalate synthase